MLSSCTPHADIELQRNTVANMSGPPGTWFPPTTIQDQAAGTKATYDDTTDITCYKEYYCVARIKDVNNAGETPSAWWWVGYPWAMKVLPSCGGTTGSIAITEVTASHNVTFRDSASYLTTTINFTDATPEVDAIRIYLDEGSGYPGDDDPTQTRACTVVNGIVRAAFKFACPHPSNVKIKFESWAANAVSTDSAETVSINVCTNVEY